MITCNVVKVSQNGYTSKQLHWHLNTTVCNMECRQ